MSEYTPDINFESTKSIDARRESIREARSIVLEMAKKKSESRERRRVHEKGFILPELEAKLERRESKKSKKKKKEKKFRSKRNDSDVANSDDEYEEVSAHTENQTAELSSETKPNKREAWMEMGFQANQAINDNELSTNNEDLMSTFLSGRDSNVCKAENKARQKAEKRRAEESARNSEWAKRELNPEVRESLGSKNLCENASIDTTQQVGDGGLSWMKRALKRAKEQSLTDGIPVESIIAERWGSFEKFEGMMKKLEGNSNSSHSDKNSRSDSKNAWSVPRSRGFHKKRDDHRSDRRHQEEGYNTTNSDDSNRSRKADEFRANKYHESRTDKSISKQSDCKEEPKATVQKVVKADESPSKSSSKEFCEVLTNDEMNALNAKIFKAEMMGNGALVAKLKNKLENSKKAEKESFERRVSSDGKSESAKVEEQVVVLTETDARGNVRPVQRSSIVKDDRGGSSKRRNKKLVVTHDGEGKRTRYFADDDQYDIKKMYEDEKTGPRQNSQQNDRAATLLSKIAARCRKNDMGDDQIDEIMSSELTKLKSSNSEQQKSNRLMKQNRDRIKRLEDCKFCIGESNHKRHLMISVGETCYLTLPEHSPLSEGHCCIVPVNHVVSSTHLDEDVFDEMQKYREALVHMFDKEMSADCIFIETCVQLQSQRRHLMYECIPVDKESVGEIAPMYFQKAINECESEWSENRKLVDLGKSGRDIRRSVPKELPFFHVDFGSQNGFAHVIEDENNFPTTFGHEVIGGMLDVEPRLWRHPKPEPFDKQKQRVLKFGAMWKTYDFTSCK